MITSSEYSANFDVVFENDRLWHKCKSCGVKFPSDVELERLSLEILKHKFIIPNKTSCNKGKGAKTQETEYGCDEDCEAPCMFAPKDSKSCVDWQKKLKTGANKDE